MKAIVKAALAVAEDYPVFPTTAKKMPCWSNAELGCKKGEGGFKVATQDPKRIVELFSHPKASTVSVPMGPMSGLLAVDPDLYKGQHVVDWHEANRHWLEKTLCHKTQSGGLHYLFEWTDAVRFPSTLAEGVDLKGNGGYVVFPPSGGYTVLRKLKVKPFPLDVLQAAMIAKGGTGNVIHLSSYNAASDADLISNIQRAVELYPALRSLAYRMPGRRQDDGSYQTKEEMIRILENLMDTSVASRVEHPRHDDWLDRRGKIPELVITAIDKERGGAGLTDAEISAIAQGESFIEAQKMIAKGTRPIGPQRETKPADILERVAELSKIKSKTSKPTQSKELKDTIDSTDFVKTNVAQLNAAVLPPIKWVLPRMIPEMSTVSLAGMSNIGKTRFLAALVVALAVGDTKRMGLPQCPRKISTVYIANEEQKTDLFRRLKAVALQHGDKTSAKFHIRGKAAGMMRLVAMNEAGNLEIDEGNVALVVNEIRRAKAKLVIFDPYVTLSDGADENSASSASMLNKAFLLITSMTGCGLIHAHHCPKDRNKDLDWIRGDASAWRGSGGIYSALDCGFTLSNWMPYHKEQRKAWKAQYLTAKLSRFIVLDTGKIREGEPLDPVMMELVPQKMGEKEGDPIGVCKLTTEATAANALLEGSIDTGRAQILGADMVTVLGVGTHTVMAQCNRKMKGNDLWPNVDKTEGKHKLSEIFGDKPVAVEGGIVHIVCGGVGKWRIVIKDKDEDDGKTI